MKSAVKMLLPTLLVAMLLSACGEKEEAPAAPEPAAVTVPDPNAAPPVAAAPAPEPAGAGGYEPTKEELVPGITVPQEELDKRNAEALKDTPKPIIPGEAPAAEATPAPPAEAAPANK